MKCPDAGDEESARRLDQFFDPQLLRHEHRPWTDVVRCLTCGDERRFAGAVEDVAMAFGHQDRKTSSCQARISKRGEVLPCGFVDFVGFGVHGRSVRGIVFA